MPLNKVTVDVDWLVDQIGRDDLVVVDGSWHLPTAQRDPKQEYESGHIKGARFFDLDKHSDQKSSLNHTMPSADQFGREMGELGIRETDTIVVYDTTGLFSAARIWWMFRQFGAHNVYVLNGGLPAWEQAGYSLETDSQPIAPQTFNASKNELHIVDLKHVLNAVENAGGTLILDARDQGRFEGTSPEPRPDLRCGHMPDAVNLPFVSLLDSERKLLPDNQLEQRFQEVGYSIDQPTVTSCGSGVTACVILLAMARLGYQNAKLYDGSWSEWGSLSNTPIATGA